MNVSEVMTVHPTCCLPEDTVDLPAKLMKIENVGAIPVVESEESRTLAGIVTDRDLALLVVGQGLNPKITKVNQILPKNQLVSCKEDDDINVALEAMERFQIRRIPVLDRRNRLVGILSQCDVALRINQPKRTAQLVTEISRPSSWEESFQERRRFSGEIQQGMDREVFLGERKESR